MKVSAVGVNDPDILQRKGQYPPPPGVSDLLGLEFSGHLQTVGSEVSTWSVGDSVCALTTGGATLNTVSAMRVAAYRYPQH